ncbi:MAG TPA: hypothetical protein VNU00_08320 [Candidatus Binataceae bacterium]|nr:hypothetical protein [Candidatus Binataceae bacterium]
MKAFGSLAAVLSAVVLMGAVLFAQHDYQDSFGGDGVAQQSVDTGSIAAYSVSHETIVMK